MKRNTLFASLAASLFVVAATAQANESVTSSAAGTTIMEDAHPVGGRGSLEHPLAIESVFPSQGPAD